MLLEGTIAEIVVKLETSLYQKCVWDETLMILAELPLDMKIISLTPAANHLFRVNERPTPKDKSTNVSQQSGQVTITI